MSVILADVVQQRYASYNQYDTCCIVGRKWHGHKAGISGCHARYC